ncbi:MAG: putative porin [Bacteroidota bacterium]
MSIRLLLFFLSSVTHSLSLSQVVPADSAAPARDSTRVSYFYNDFDREGKLNLSALDTVLTGFQNYDLLTNYSSFYATLGNVGSAYNNLFPYPLQQTGGFDFGVHTFENYLYENDSVRYYRVLKTYTELEYVQGAKKELNFIARLSRNIYRGLNLGFYFHVSNSPGAYLRQKTNLVNFVLTAQFFSKTKRYGVIANFVTNRIKNEENGGLKYDSIFEQNLETNRQIIAVNLPGAQNRIREMGFYVKQYFDLTRHDPNQTDSTKWRQKRFELGRITYSFHYNRQIFNYNDGDPTAGFYSKIYFDSIRTADSVTIQQIENVVTWTNPSFHPTRKYRRIQVEFKLKHQYLEVTYPEVQYYELYFDRGWASIELVHPHQRTFFNQIIPSGWIAFRPFNTFTLEAYTDYVLGSYNEGDVSFNAKVSQILGSVKRNLGVISLAGFYRYHEPDWFYQKYQSNNFRWNNEWKKEGLISAVAVYTNKYFTLGASMSRLTNHVYLDTAALPQQVNDEIGYIRSWLNTDIDLWRFKFKGNFAFQTVQGSNVIRVPAFMGNLTIYFTQPLFRGAAVIQPGLNFFYNTSYYADSYMPATRMFFLQDRKEIGNYIYMDVFLNVKIQRARFFATYTHFNASFMGRTYFMVPNYPMQDGAFKFGVSWRFHD